MHVFLPTYDIFVIAAQTDSSAIANIIPKDHTMSCLFISHTHISACAHASRSQKKT